MLLFWFKEKTRFFCDRLQYGFSERGLTHPLDPCELIVFEDQGIVPTITLGRGFTRH